MKTTLAQYLIAFLTFLAIDAAWLMTMGKTLYAAEIGPILREKPDLTHAFIFYVLFVAGLVAFVIQPSLLAGSATQALVKGAFFGLVCYATYDLTNLATLKGFTTRIAIIDMAWGAFLSASVSWITYTLVKALKIVGS